MTKVVQDEEEQIKIEFLKLLEDDVGLSVIMILQTYKSLNLRQISKLLSMTEPSAHVHMKRLLAMEYIEYDEEMADKRGKYYKLTKGMSKYIQEDQLDEDLSSKGKNVNTDYYHTMGYAIKTMTLVTQRFGMYLGNYLLDEENSEQLAKRHNEKVTLGKEKEIINLVNGTLSFIPVANKEELDEVHNLMVEYLQKLQKISEKNEELKDEDIYEQVMISSLMLPLYQVDPRKKILEI